MTLRIIITPLVRSDVTVLYYNKNYQIFHSVSRYCEICSYTTSIIAPPVQGQKVAYKIKKHKHTHTHMNTHACTTHLDTHPHTHPHTHTPTHTHNHTNARGRCYRPNTYMQRIHANTHTHTPTHIILRIENMAQILKHKQ